MRAVGPPLFRVNSLVVGAGAVGLSIASRLLDSCLSTMGTLGAHSSERSSERRVLVVEREPLPGLGVSSRNSEVIHAGIYYPANSLKARLCVEGNSLIYRFCEHHKVPYRMCGKWVVATDPSEYAALDTISTRAASLGVPLRKVLHEDIARDVDSANVMFQRALESPRTGIFDSHAFMQALEARVSSHAGGDVAYSTYIAGIVRENIISRSSGRRVESGFRVFVRDDSHEEDGTTYSFFARNVVNSTGLHSRDFIAECVVPNANKTIITTVDTSLDTSPSVATGQQESTIEEDCTTVEKLQHVLERSTVHACKGYYYRYTGSKPPVHRLVYPVPMKNLRGLGIHATVDLSGSVRFGPNAEYVHELDDFTAEDSQERHAAFVEAIQRYLPGVDARKVAIDYAAIRPKLSGPGEPFRDFGIEHLFSTSPSTSASTSASTNESIEVDEGSEGSEGRFIHLYGIESPGLTASLAIGNEVVHMLGHTDVPSADWMLCKVPGYH